MSVTVLVNEWWGGGTLASLIMIYRSPSLPLFTQLGSLFSGVLMTGALFIFLEWDSFPSIFGGYMAESENSLWPRLRGTASALSHQCQESSHSSCAAPDVFFIF